MDAILEFFSRTRIDLGVSAFRLLLTFVLGGLVGLEREWHRQSAGLRTHTVIAIGSTLLTLVSFWIPQQWPGGGDPGRIAAQIVSGIGFLGGGAIFRLGANVKGLTTAASIWVVAGIGMAVGAGMYLPAVVGTAIVLFTLFVMVRFEKRLFPGRSLRNLEIVVNGRKVNTDPIFPLLEEHGIEVTAVNVAQSFEEKTIHMKLTVRVPEEIDWNGLYRRIGHVPGISKVSVDQRI